MRKPVFVFSILIAAVWSTASGCGGAVNPALYGKFQAAQQAFDTASSPAEFLRAAALYQEIRDAGIQSGAVLYNQGNAFMRAGQRGRAVACYRQAMRYRPRDPYLDANLRYALGETTGAAKSKPILEYLLFWQDWISYPGKFDLTTYCGAITCVVGMAGLFVQRMLLRRLAAACLLLTLILGLSAAYDWYRFDYLEQGVIIRDEVVARKGGAASYEPAFTKPLTQATEFRVIDRRGDWLLVRLPGAQEGWVKLDDVVVF